MWSTQKGFSLLISKSMETSHLWSLTIVDESHSSRILNPGLLIKELARCTRHKEEKLSMYFYTWRLDRFKRKGSL